MTLPMEAPNKAELPGGVEISYWTAEDVQARLARAAETLRALRVSGMRPGGHRNTWPDVVQDFWDAYGDNEKEPRRGTPSSRAIDEMDEVIGWLFWLDDRNARIVVWGKAMGIKTGKIADRLGVHRETARRWYREAVEIVLRRLNA